LQKDLLEKAGLDVPGLYKVFQSNAPVSMSDMQARIAQSYEFDDGVYAALTQEALKNQCPS